MQVLAPLQEFSQQCPQTQVLLQPAAADAHHVPVHPQPALPGAPHLDMLPSPAHLQAGHSGLTVSSSTVLFDLSSAAVGELVRAPVPSRCIAPSGIAGAPSLPEALRSCCLRPCPT